jgi:hypothetical protein
MSNYTASPYISDLLQTADKPSAQELLEIGLLPQPIAIEVVSGTLTGSLGAVLMAPAQNISIAGVAYNGSGKWVQSLNVGTHTSAIFNFPDLCGVIDAAPSLPVGDYPELKFVTKGFLANPSFPVRPLIFPKLVLCFSMTPAAGVPATSIELPELVMLLGTLQVSPLPNCTHIDLSKVVSLGGFTVGTAPLLTTITLPPVGVFKEVTSNTFTVTGAALNQTTVDNILNHLAYMDGNNGTRLFSGGINISGGTTSPPSNLGSVATPGSNFVCSGTTCTVNMTNHGYSTGDVLRISGVTTATNANRYAVITVLSANQFRYTISSQNATGAGTATVIKTSDSIKALITRGVSLTTN